VKKDDHESLDGFLARSFPFVWVEDQDLLQERVIFKFTLKHLFFIGLGVALLVSYWMLGLIVLIFTTLSALYPRRALSLETELWSYILFIMYRLTKSKQKTKVELPTVKSEEATREMLLRDIRVNIAPEVVLTEGIEDVLEYVKRKK